MTTQANKHVCHILHRISIQPHPALTRFCGQKQKNPYPTSKSSICTTGEILSHFRRKLIRVQKLCVGQAFNTFEEVPFFISGTESSPFQSFCKSKSNFLNLVALTVTKVEQRETVWKLLVWIFPSRQIFVLHRLFCWFWLPLLFFGSFWERF